MTHSAIHGLYRSILNGDWQGYRPNYEAARSTIQAHARCEGIGSFGRFVSQAESAELDIFAEQLIAQIEQRDHPAFNRLFVQARAQARPVVYWITLQDNACGIDGELRVAGKDWRYRMGVDFNDADPLEARKNFKALIYLRLKEANTNPLAFFFPDIR